MALTGGIGSGKSEALAAFAACGAAVLSSDAVVHGLYSEPGVVAAVGARFGADVVSAGSVDRSLLGRRAFAEEGGIAFLEELLHPLIGGARTEWIAAQAARRPAPPLLVCEVPLLFEAGIADRFDAALVVTASDAVRRGRVQARGQDFADRSSRQMAEAEKVARADHSFINDGPLESLRSWVAARYAEYSGRPCDTAGDGA